MLTLFVLMGGSLLGCSRSTDPPRAEAGPAPEPTATVKAPDEKPSPGTSASQGGKLIGSRPPPWSLEAWDGSAPIDLFDLRGCVVMVRFWTDTCPHCRKSLPAMQQLSEKLADAPVRFVGLYHEKPRGRAVRFPEVVSEARSWGVRFPLAFDRGWDTLRAWWLKAGQRRATSASFVLDPEGRIAHIHPGPVFFPSDDTADSKPNRDYHAIVAAIGDAAEGAPGCETPP